MKARDPMQTVETLIETGSYAEILSTANTWSEKEKRQIGKLLLAYWKEWRERLSFKSDPVLNARWMKVVIANTVVARNAKDALVIPSPQRLRGWREMYPVDTAARGIHLEALAAKGKEWVADYVSQATTAKRAGQVDIDLAVALTLHFDLPLPQEAEFYELWAGDLFRIMPRSHNDSKGHYERLVACFALDTSAEPAVVVGEQTAVSPLEAASLKPAWNILISELLAHADSLDALFGKYASTEDNEATEAVLVGLMSRGLLDRVPLADKAIAALTRGDSVKVQRLQARVLLAADPAIEQIEAQRNTLLGLLASAHGSAADAALTLLCRLDEARPLAGDFFVNACEMVFARKEKGLRDRQLEWSARRATACTDQIGMTLGGIFAALSAEDYPFQKKAAQLILKHWPKLAADEQGRLREEFTRYQAGLETGVCKQLAEGLGIDAKAQADSQARTSSSPGARALVESRPVVRFTVPAADAATLRELTAQMAHDATVNVCEQTIAVALTLAQMDRHALKLGLQHLAGDYPLGLLFALQSAAYGKESPGWQAYSWITSGTTQIADIARLRREEIAGAIKRGGVYAYISRPDFSNGSIEAAELIRRLDHLARQGLAAEPMDLFVALLRTQMPTETERQVLRAIRSEQAEIAAEFFDAGGMGQMTTCWQVVNTDPAEIGVSLSGMVMPRISHIPDIPDQWAAGFAPDASPRVWEFDLAEGLLASILPNDGEILAALGLRGFRNACHDLDTEGGKAYAKALPIFLAARGPAGPAMHLAILYSLSGNDPAARLAGSDGLLELIAQTRYDSELAVQLVSAGIACRSLKAGRLAKSLQPVVEAGAASIVWPVLRAALIASLDQTTPPPGTPELLALATQVASGQGLREVIPTLAGTAARKGSSKLLLEARRLHELLSGGQP
ncbi:DUF6493 family protein [Uliginosibacterium sp. H3]|uniref:DUF6493 family protein n=1 Tax=Uliginosibacterium silvisoli TaxID=3114758 RepID=A0ABU6K031_9RHOO|nr:DUF6493 family protein [Uliginosibacterium sp. H3]